MTKQPVFGADDLRHPDHAGPNPFADAGSSGQTNPHPLAGTANASDYKPTGYAPALAPRGRQLMTLASTGTLLAVLGAAGSLLTVLLYVATLMTPALTLPAITMSTRDLRAMRAGAMDQTDLELTVWARRVAAVGLAVAAIACWPLIRRVGSALMSLSP